MNSRSPQISVVLGSYNRKSFLKRAVKSIRDNGISVPYEIIVVDGGSTDGSLAWLQKQKDIITILQHNRGYFRGQTIQRQSWGYFMNLGFKCAQGKFIVMISDDSLLVPGSVMNGLKHYEHLSSQGRNIGALAFFYRNWPEQRDYFVKSTLGDKIYVNHGMFLQKALKDVGWIEERRYQFYHADGDLCLKLWQHGYEVVDCPEAFVEHFRHANIRLRKRNMQHDRSDWAAYLDRWSGSFYDPVSNNIGRRIYRSHKDIHKTVRRFPKGSLLLLAPVFLFERLTLMFHELMWQDREDGRATGQPSRGGGIGPEAYLNCTSQDPTPEDARKDGQIQGHSKPFMKHPGEGRE